MQQDDHSASNGNPVPVFWTGGWDSTCRVLELVVRYRCPVQPIYVIDKSRRSWQIEMKTMQLIRERLRLAHPNLSGLLAPTLFLDLADLQTPELLKHPYVDLAKSSQTSAQYVYLSTVSDKLGLPKIEVAVHLEDGISTFDFVWKKLRQVQLFCGATTYELDRWDASDPNLKALILLEKFRFLYMQMHPSELEPIAVQYGFSPLLDLAWTCQIPMFGEPCGVCGICRVAINAGKTQHYPKAALARYRLAPVLTPVWIMISNPKGGLREIAKRILRSRTPPAGSHSLR